MTAALVLDYLENPTGLRKFCNTAMWKIFRIPTGRKLFSYTELNPDVSS